MLKGDEYHTSRPRRWETVPCKPIGWSLQGFRPMDPPPYPCRSRSRKIRNDESVLLPSLCSSFMFRFFFPDTKYDNFIMTFDENMLKYCKRVNMRTTKRIEQND